MKIRAGMFKSEGVCDRIISVAADLGLVWVVMLGIFSRIGSNCAEI